MSSSRGSLWRTLRTPRWLLLTAVLVVFGMGCWQLGTWQLSVARNDSAQQVLAEQRSRPVVPLAEVLAPQQPFPEDGSNRPVRAEGRYDPRGQFLVPERLLEGRQGLWVVTPLEVADTGATLLVVRGFVTDPGQAGTVETAPLVVEGTLAPGESPADDAGLPEGQRGSIDLSALANERPGDWYNAFVFAQQEQPRLSAADVEPIPPPAAGGGLDWRNLGYALQWWVFAGFAIFLWWRQLREETRPTVEPST